MKLTDAERDIVDRARKALDDDPVTTLFSPMWVEKLLGIIDRLSQEAEVVRCENCVHSREIKGSPKKWYFTDRVMHCAELRGSASDDGISAVWRNGYCDDGERKEGNHE